MTQVSRPREVNTDETFSALLHHASGDINNAGGYDIECPHCGKEPARGQIHCHFSEGQGYYCFVCRNGGSLEALLSLIEGKPRPSFSPKTSRPVHRSGRLEPKGLPNRERPWQEEAARLIQVYRQQPSLVRSWQSYKGVTEYSIDRYQLGLGRLPGQSTPRLIVPVFYKGTAVALHGRDMTHRTDVPKWICAKGSSRVALGLDDLRQGQEIWLCENYVDSILMQQQLGDKFACIAIGGVRMLYAEEMAAIIASKPKRVVVCLDNDLVGNPNKKLYPKMVAAWRAAHPDSDKIPEPFGPRIGNQLREANLSGYLFPWPDNAPHKADVGWVLAGGA